MLDNIKQVKVSLTLLCHDKNDIITGDVVEETIMEFLSEKPEPWLVYDIKCNSIEEFKK